MALSELLIWQSDDPAGGNPPLLLEARTDAGLSALAELLPAAAPAELGEALEQFSPLVLGRDPWERGALWQHLAELIEWQDRPAGADTALLSALDLALWQLLSQQTGEPLYRLLGGAYFARLDTYEFFRPAHLSHSPPPGGLLLEPGSDSPEEILRAAEQLRRQHGDRLRLFVSLEESASDLAQALEWAHRLQSIEVFCCLDLLPLTHVREYAEVARTAEVPLGAGTWASGLRDYLRLLRDAHLDLLAVDLRSCGGFTGAQRLTSLGAAHRLPVALRAGTWSPSLLLAQHLALTSGWYLPVARPAEGAPLPSGYQLRDGFAELPAAPCVPDTGLLEGYRLLSDT